MSKEYRNKIHNKNRKQGKLIEQSVSSVHWRHKEEWEELKQMVLISDPVKAENTKTVL